MRETSHAAAAGRVASAIDSRREQHAVGRRAPRRRQTWYSPPSLVVLIAASALATSWWGERVGADPHSTQTTPQTDPVPEAHLVTTGASYVPLVEEDDDTIPFADETAAPVAEDPNDPADAAIKRFWAEFPDCQRIIARIAGPQPVDRHQLCREILSVFLNSKTSYAGNRVVIDDILLEEGASLYQALQAEVAEQVKKESQRPVIDIKFITNTANRKWIGLLGGTGPLSDAGFIGSLAEAIKKRGSFAYNIHLISAPPPRTLAEKVKGITDYMSNLWILRSAKYDKYAMVSNTAHLNFGKFTAIVGNNAFNLVEYIAGTIKAKNPPGIFVVGTSQAHRGALYPKALAKRGLTTVKTPTKAEQEVIQAFIDSVKRNDDYKSQIPALKQIIKQNTQTNNYHVIFSCTELSLAFKDQLRIEADRTTFDVDGTSVVVYDTEAMMTDAILSLP